MNEAALQAELRAVNLRREELHAERAYLDSVPMKMRNPSWSMRYTECLTASREARLERSRLGQMLHDIVEARKVREAQAMFGVENGDIDIETLLLAVQGLLFNIPREALEPQVAAQKDTIGSAIKRFLADVSEDT